MPDPRQHSPSLAIAGVLFRRDPVALVGILLSVALSVTLDVTNAASGVESLLAGLAGTTLALMLDSIVRAERRFGLRRLLEATPWFADSVHSLAGSAHLIQESYPRSPIVDEARDRLERLGEGLLDLSRGRIERDGADFEHLVEPTTRAQHRIEAVTNIMPETGRLAWWEEDIGRRYWRANLAARARGVRITRIFTYDEMTPALRGIIEEQRRAGVETYALHRDLVPASLQVNFVIWDGARAWEPRLNTRGAIVSNIYTENAHDLARLRDAYQRLRAAAARARE